MKKVNRKWRVCPMCGMMVYSATGLGQHVCPDKIRARVEAELDMATESTMETFEMDARRFWNTNEARFYEYLAKNKRL